ncbi:methyl-accepting chemotaxis protein [Gracilinema caldarium]|uniref:Methyl-accepting chemotaxis sensory transducer n=1 Tax=Gracilinema caldarium (strain ATCC 51460 / DSM 7334 / H1) TaxID=744872 RepID=F8F0W5_GRAC1|nr:methyl-accepting chemotaxis protein [Gracilinema caldarium]AEJ20251.1 methyl-accepting chemotaxis sensory transducer [Gracilinema caldarium DSM 7334]
MNTACDATESLVKLIRLCNTAHQLDDNVLSLEQLAEHQATTAGSIHAGLESYLASLNKILGTQQASSEKLIENSETIVQWLDKEQDVSRLFKKSTKEVQSVWDEIRDISPSILKMIESIRSINNIFDLLHILSINTAIEASKFGDRGRAFAIIAKEMRKLADQSRSFIDSIKEQGTMVDTRVRQLVKNLSQSINSYTNLEHTVEVFLSDSMLVRDNTQVVYELIEQYKTLSETHIREWQQSVQQIKALEEIADTVLTRSKQIQSMADTLFSMIREETELASKTNTRFHARAIQEARELAMNIQTQDLYNRQILDKILTHWSSTHELFELLYILDSFGIQVSGNIYAPRYRALHHIDEGYGVDRSYKDYFSLPKKNMSPYVSSVYLSVATKALCITVSIPLLYEDRFNGVVCADVDLQYLSNFSYLGD